MKIAIMQPYYYPYAGYFRLFASADLFVILDDVQFNRRGRVHRCEVNKKWFATLPIKKTSRDETRIMDLEWQKGKEHSRSPLNFIVDALEEICGKLYLPFKCFFSSEISIPSHLRGQDRIIAICKKLGAREYINSPGGKNLYDEKEFKKNEVKLTFLPEWTGNYDSVLHRLAYEDSSDIRKEIYEQI